MLFQSSIRAELGRSFGASLLVLFTIVVTIMLIRTLSLASSGRVDPQEVMLVLSYTVLGRMHLILTMALFVAVVSVVARLYRDSEMVIWLSSGQHLGRLIGPLFRFAWPILAAMTVLVMLVWPWANQQSAELRQRFSQRGDLQRVQPGQFQANASGDRVFFIDKHSDRESEGRNVLISTLRAGAESTISARAAEVQTTDDGSMLTFLQGQRFELLEAGAGFRLSNFDQYQVQLGDVNLPTTPLAEMRARSTWDIVTDPSQSARAELSWRVGLLLTAVNLTLIALAVSTSNPRAGKGANIAFALLAFLTYSNVLNVGIDWIEASRVTFWTWTIGLHGSVLLITLLAIGKQQQGFSVRSWWKRRWQRADAAPTRGPA